MNKFETRKYFDIHDQDVTPEIYTLLFVLIELQGNDLVYTYHTDGIYEDKCMSKEHLAYMDKLWRERLKKGPNNCYFDRARMEEFCKNPCSYTEAYALFKKWLKEKGLTKEDKEILIKIWW